MPIPTVAIQVEGVLRKTVTQAPLDQGKRLYHALAVEYNLVLVTEDLDREQMKTWLAMEGYSKHAHVVFGDSVMNYDKSWWLAVAKTLKLSFGYDIEYIVQPDPVEAATLVKHGYNSMLLTNAAYALPEWRPDAWGKVQPWNEIVEEVITQKRLRAEDKRMDGH
jgi:diphthamide synthase (EF-2-diphthine--ammonia ligase)